MVVGMNATACLTHSLFHSLLQVIDQAELQRRMDAARDSGEQHFYIMELSPGLYIDAKKKGNHARLLNSSCDPNCETQKW